MDMKLEVVVVPVSDVEKSKDFCTALGRRLSADLSEVFHDAGGVFHHADTDARVPGPDPKRNSYGSFLSFNDPNGNGRLRQEITTRLPGRVDPATTVLASAADLAGGLRRAAAAHGEHEARTGAELPS
jgi:catechol 2,3-dioxygenase-like lactoylglutathione lyase family enzyme